METFPEGILRFRRHPTSVVSLVCLAVCIISMLLPMTLSTANSPWPSACNLDSSSNDMSDSCECNFNAKTVMCHRNGQLDRVPNNILPDVTALSLAENKLKVISETDFANLEFIKTLYLQDNEISYIHPKAFQNLYRMTILNLERNRLNGQLDTTARMFQHLSAISRIALQGNEIGSVNKFSFLTAVTSSNTVSVKFDGNPIECNCEVKALRDWARSFQNSRIDMDIRCPDGRLYTELSDQEFGACANNDNVLSTFTPCPYCNEKRTNYKCSLRQGVTCSGASAACRQTINWRNDTKTMKITSRCDSYNSCLDQENQNQNKCGLRYEQNGNVHCDFCCIGPTCTEYFNGGRTVDYTFLLNYLRDRAPYDYTYMNNPRLAAYVAEQNRIDSLMRKVIKSLYGGFDTYVLRFDPFGNGHKVSLVIETTVFYPSTPQEVIQVLQSDIQKDLLNPDSFLRNEDIFQNSLNISFSSGAPSPSPTYIPVTTTPTVQTCPKEVTIHSDFGRFEWQKSPGGTTQVVFCKNVQPGSSAIPYAERRCVINSQGVARWEDPDYSKCEEAATGDIIDEKVTPDNAEEVSNALTVRTEKAEDTNTQELTKYVKVLEDLSKEENLLMPNVANNVVKTMSNLVDTDPQVLKEAEEKESTSKRLVRVLDRVGELSPLNRNGNVKYVTPNVAVAAQGLRQNENRDIGFTTTSGPDDQLRNVNVGFINNANNDGSSLIIPTSALRNSLSEGDKQKLNRVAFSALRSDSLFKSMNSEEKLKPVPPNTVSKDAEKKGALVTKVNSHVISASVPGVPIHKLNRNVTMTFEHHEGNSSNPQCVFWDEAMDKGKGDWSSNGCGVVTTSDTKTTCGCNHLTNFALLMDVYQEGVSLSALDRKVLSIISYVGCGISLLSLALTLLTYGLFKKLRRDNPSKILVNLCLALLLSNLVYVAGMHDYTFDNTVACKVVAALLHYFLLSAFTWMAVEAFYMYLALVLVFKTYFTNFILKCSLIGWGVPLVIVAVTLGIDKTNNYGLLNNGLCWLTNPAFYAAFVAPVLLILLLNLIAFIMVVKQLISMSSKKLNKTDRSNTVQRLCGAIGVVILLGLSWLFALFAIDQASVVFYYLFAVFNSLQGLFIFIFYCLLKKDAITAWKRAMPCFEEYGEQSKPSSNSRVGTSSANNGVRMNKYVTNSSTSGAQTTSSTLDDSAKNSYSGLDGGLDNNVYQTIDDAQTVVADPKFGNVSYGQPPSSPARSPVTPAATNGVSSVYTYANAEQVTNQNTYHNSSDERPPKSDVTPSAPPYSYLRNTPRTGHQQAHGEIDASNIARVDDLKLRFERTMSATSDRVTNT